MSLDLAELRAAVARTGRVARVVVAEAQGSAPREAGAAMLVWADGQEGTIGGGALEFEAADLARRVLSGAAAPGLTRYPLGPALGQCCGGAVTLVTEIYDAVSVAEIAHPVHARRVTGAGPAPLPVTRALAQIRRGTEPPALRLIEGWLIEPVAAPAHALWLHGAGHVGRAIASVMAPLPDWAITWLDTGADRFPDVPPAGVDVLVAAEPARALAHAPPDAHHLILTYSHALDLALCDAVLTRGFASAGLIGSRTKWARFRKRLTEAGHAPAEIDRIRCPIGDPALGKHPQAIAIGAAAALVRAVSGDAASPAEERRA
ncbi:MAG: xanthine dehydrogenase accessory protein XdhC [Pseudomonadota bacterium]